ncbi:MAG TPA: DUF2167 domain-containing protein [Opitutaceae bacterium]|jgi:uncharacterized membrane-anchored protein|nr:DUF2167 domain-containing protein [Opitutaceae bacterium]
MKYLLASAFALLLPCAALCEVTDPAAHLAEDRALANSIHYESGTIKLNGDMATVELKPGYRFVNAEDTGKILSGIWHNPKQNEALGMVVPEDFNPLGGGAWAVVITYTDDGYVKDEDAGKINYGDLMKRIQEGTQEANKTRVENGYPAMEVIGWAETPRYDETTHKMYWAKEIKFGTHPVHTLNYNIRILGRSGVLVLNAVASMQELAVVRKATPNLLAMVDFSPGHRYADFKEGTDKVATYGIAALVLGGIAAKVGLFKALWIGILALKKFIIIGAIAVARYAKKWWNKIRGQTTPERT